MTNIEPLISIQQKTEEKLNEVLLLQLSKTCQKASHSILLKE
ncbi:hypothetical protein SAMN05216323_104517 [Williamwhitmania taraxaci]|uniref:Uncharacterized protein n=1 Tax=Williamwhitmania taraxaci TaxID=1640674 RepID=A0A1G6NT44_9BACT|nr:hypothetical protein SAMN05216323_104517 [Williamwhitmania taraxaci]